MTRWQSDKAKYSRIVSWKVVEKATPLGNCLRILATFADGSERLVQGTFRTRDQLDRYVDRFLAHLRGREIQDAAPAAALAHIAEAGLNEDQQGFLEFISGVSDEQLRSTSKSYGFLADFGRADDIWKRDACLNEFRRRGLELPQPDEAHSELPNLLDGADPA